MNKAEKQVEIESLSESFRRAPITLCGSTIGLTVAQVSALRRELRTSGAARSRLVKNKLGKISAERVFKDANQAELQKFLETFKGSSLVVFADDPVGPSKVFTKFAKDIEKFQVKGGWFEGTFVDKAGVESLSKMPGRAETLAGLLRVINGPATQLARILQAPGEQLVRVLEAHRKNLEAKG